MQFHFSFVFRERARNLRLGWVVMFLFAVGCGHSEPSPVTAPSAALDVAPVLPIAKTTEGGSSHGVDTRVTLSVTDTDDLLDTGASPETTVESTSDKPLPRVFTEEEHQAWCKKEIRPRTWGPEGVYKLTFPSILKKECRDRFTYRVKRFVAGVPEWADYGHYEVAVVHLADSGETEEVFLFDVVATASWDEEYLKIFKVGDINGDGTAEVFFAIHVHGEGTFEWNTTLLELQADRLVPLALPNGIVAENIADYDGDGMYDVFTNGPYYGIQQESAIGGASPVFTLPALFLARSLGNYKFSFDDEWTKKIARDRCPQKIIRRWDTDFELDGPNPMTEAGPDWRNPRQIVCARVHGMKKNKVMNALRKQCGRTDDVDIKCSASMKQIAQKDPLIYLSSPR